MMGYAMIWQRTSGIHLRLRSRAFIVQQGNSRIVFVSCDLGMITQAIRQTVERKLIAIFGPTLYTLDNVMLSAQHTHGGPGGYAWHPMYDISTLGFQHQNFDAIVDGIVKSIQRAHNNLAPGSIKINRGKVDGSNLNRSPTAYMANPSEERSLYEFDVDHESTTLRFTQTGGKEIGMVGWFSVHGTSMKNTNYYISGDNKGYASYLFEKFMNSGALPGKGSFVAVMANSNEGDVTPNIKGAFCDNGMPCERAHSTCGGWSQGCHGYGPGSTDFESCRIIGQNQFDALKKTFDSSTRSLNGSVKYMHSWVDFEHVWVTPEYSGLGKSIKTCVGALGDSFAAGTTDGPGEFNFVQGTNDSDTNWYWHWLTSRLLAEPTKEDHECHYPKPILLMTGRILWPAKWTQGIIPIQIFNIGSLWILGVPTEMTTMAGRRLRHRVAEAIQKAGAWTPESHIVIAGLANSYTHYVTTREEYAYQRYEGASNLFGPSTLGAYEMLLSDMATRMIKNLPPLVSAVPENISDAIFILQPPPPADSIPAGIQYGQVAADAAPSYRAGQTVEVHFWTGNPRHNLRTEGTFLEVSRKEPNGSWKVILTDGDWETKYWYQYVPGGAQAHIKWDTPPTTNGIFKITHYGDWKNAAGTITPFVGQSREFSVSS